MNRKITAILIVMTMIITLFPQMGLAYVSESEITNLGGIIKDIKFSSSITTVEDGIPVFIGIHTGIPAQLDVINLNTMKVIRTIEIPYGESFHTMTKNSKGDVYFAGYTNPHLYVYSVTEKKVTDLGATLSETAICDMVCDENDVLYMGSFPNAKILRYTPGSGKIEDLGEPLPESDSYLKTLGYHNGYLYGGGNSASGCIFKYDISSGKSTQIPLPAEWTTNLSSIYSGAVVGNRFVLYCRYLTGSHSYIVYNLISGEWVKKIDKAISGITDEEDGFCYLAVNNKFVKYNLTTDEMTETSLSVNACQNKYFSDITVNGVTGRYYVHRVDTAIYLYDFSAGTRKVYDNVIPKVACQLQSIYATGGKLYASSFMGGAGVEYNLSDGQVISQFSIGQSTPIAENNGKIYYATYPSTDLVEFDPTLAVSAKNPKILFSLPEENQGRPMDICFAEDKIIVSTIGGYNYLEGCLIVYDTKTGTYEKNKGIIENQSLTGLCYYNGYVYITTTVTGGIGSVEAETDCRIAKYNLETGVIEKIITPSFKTVTGNCKMCGDIVAGPDGKLWCTSDGLVFSLNPDTLEIIDELEIERMIWKGTSRWAPYKMIFDSENNLYAMPDSQLYKINIFDKTYEKILPDSIGAISDFTLNEYGELFYMLPASPNVYALNLKTADAIEPKEPAHDGDYYLISDEAEFMWIKDNPDEDYKLVSDISIGSERFPFTEPFEFNGTLIGDSETEFKTINVNIATSNDNVGLFSNSSGCRIENIKLTGSVKGGNHTGGFIGTFSDSSSSKYTLKNLINEAIIQGVDEVGGFVGRSHNTLTKSFENCKNYGPVSGKYDVGGICGTLGADVYYCANYAKITGTSKVGGIGGWSTKAEVYYSYNMGDVYSSGSAAGGIIGEAMYAASNILYCYNTGDVKSDSGAAGAAFGNLSDARGAFTVKVRYFYNLGDISGTYTSPLIGATSTCQFANFNAFYLKMDGNSDTLSESLSLSDMKKVNHLGSTRFVQSETAYKFPQLKDNINYEEFDIYNVTVKVNGSGTTDVDQVLVRNGNSVKIVTEGTGDGVSLAKITINGTPVSDPSSVYEFCPTEDSDVEFYYYVLGTANNPYVINSRESFLKIKENPSAYYIVTKDIDLGSYEPFAFSGALVADSLTAINVNIDMPDTMNIGLFSEISGNFLIENIKVTGSISGDGFVGGFAGLVAEKSSGAFKNCVSSLDTLKCNTQGKNGNSGRCVGGIVGRSYGTGNTLYSGCKNYSKIPLAKNNAGGIAGLGSGTFEYCSNYADIKADNQIGGIAGWFTGGTINGCYNLGEITGVQKVGGLIGHIQYNNVTVSSSFNAGALTATKGIIGAFAGSAVYTTARNLNISNFYSISNRSGRLETDGEFVGNVSNYTVTVNNSVTLSPDAKNGDSNTLTVTPAELENMSFEGMSPSTDKEIYPYPQIDGNLCDKKIKASILNISSEGEGSINKTGGFIVTTLSPVSATISSDADTEYYFVVNGFVSDINKYAETNGNNIIFNSESDADIHIVFDGVKDKTADDITKYFSYIPVIYHYADRTWSGSTVGNTVLIKEAAAAFSHTAQFDCWELCEWGIEENGIKYKADDFSEDGRYGILFHGANTKLISKNLIRGYSTYKNTKDGKVMTFYTSTAL